MNDGLKQRVIGALVLIALAVIFIPTVLNLSDGRVVDTTSKIPPQPDITPIEIASPKRVEGVDPAPEPDKMFQFGVSRADEGESLLDEASGLDEKGVVKAWVVQVGGFSDINKARDFVEKLQADNYKAFMQKGPSSAGTIYRVFVGPKIEKQKALNDKKSIDKKYAVKSIIVRFEP